jgi:hypothetical protein
MSSKTLTRRSRASREPLQMMEEDARCDRENASSARLTSDGPVAFVNGWLGGAGVGR